MARHNDETPCRSTNAIISRMDWRGDSTESLERFYRLGQHSNLIWILKGQSFHQSLCVLNSLDRDFPVVYAAVADAHGRNASLTSVEVRASTLSGTRKIVEAIFTFTNSNTDVDKKFFVRIDVTEEFPFLVTKLSPYFDR